MRNNRWVINSSNKNTSSKHTSKNTDEIVEDSKNLQVDNQSQEVNEDTGVYTLQDLDTELFNDGYLPYMNGLELLGGKGVTQQLAIVPVVEAEATIIGVSSGDMEGSPVTTKISRGLDKYAKEVKPLFVYYNMIKDNKDLAYFIHQVSQGLKLTSIKELDSEKLGELGLTFGSMYFSSITTKDLELVDKNRAEDLIDTKLQHYNGSTHVNAELSLLTEGIELFNSDSDFLLYSPLLDRIVGLPWYIIGRGGEFMRTRYKNSKTPSNILNILLVVSIVLLFLAICGFILVYLFASDGGTVTYEHVKEQKVDTIEPIKDVTLVRQNEDIACFDASLPRDLTGRESDHCIDKKYFKNGEFKDGKNFKLVRAHGTNANGQFYEGYIFARLPDEDS